MRIMTIVSGRNGSSQITANSLTTGSNAIIQAKNANITVLDCAKKVVNTMTSEEFINDRFDIKTLTGLGFFKKGDSIEAIEKKICMYFDLKNVFMYDHIMNDKSETVKADLETFSIN